MGEAGRQVAYALRRAQQALRTATDRALREEGLTTPQHAVLKLVAGEPGLSAAELARRGFVTPQTMNEIVTGLEAAALVTRSAHPMGGRRLEVAATALGRRTLERGDAIVETIERRLVEGLDEAEVRAVYDALERVARNLTR
jgi:DNA-binding MarR family transcriptional regulator